LRQEASVDAVINVTPEVAVLGAISGLIYVGTISAVALIAVLSRDCGRRADARRALQILLHRRNALVRVAPQTIRTPEE
jgi:hypothetical protein